MQSATICKTKGSTVAAHPCHALHNIIIVHTHSMWGKRPENITFIQQTGAADVSHRCRYVGFSA